MPPERSPTLCFNDLALDLERGCLRRGSTEVRLRPKSFEVLRYLVEHPHRLISKDELIRAGWPSAFVTDNSLVQTLIEVRRALGDERQTMIRTVPRRGYIFDVPVVTVNGSGGGTEQAHEPAPGIEAADATGGLAGDLPHGPEVLSAPDAPSPSGRVLRRGRSVDVIVGALVITCAVLAVARDVGFPKRFLASPSSQTIRSIAVLPLEGLSNEPDLDYFADGVTDALITDLAQINALRVISWTTAMQYKRSRQSLPAIAQELNVDAVIEGTAARSGNRVRIDAQLLLAREDEHLWAKSYEGDLQNILGLQDEIARDIADEVKVKLAPQEKVLLASGPLVIPEAYDNYLKSRQFILGAQRTADDARKSLEYARRAIALQPGSALLLANVADALVTMNLLGGGTAHEVMPEAKATAERALRMDDSIGAAHYALAMVHFNYDWDFPAADHEFTRALHLEPGAAETHSFYGFCLSAMGRHDEAVREMRSGLELDPLSILQNRNLGSALYYARRYDEAVAQFEHTEALAPNYPVVDNWLSWLFQARGMDPQAVEWGLKNMAANGASPTELAAIRARVARDGPRVYWLEFLKQARGSQLNRIPGGSAYQLAAAAVHMGETREAMEYLQRAVDDRVFWVPFVNVDPRFDDLHSDPRFKDLLHHVGLR